MNREASLDAVILSAGYGKRMGELTHNIPKPMVALGGIPLIYYTLYLLQVLGAEKIGINLFFKKELLVHELKKIESKSAFQFYFFEEEVLLGTAAGLANILEKQKQQQSFYLINCDVLIAFTQEEILSLQKLAASIDTGFLVVEESRGGQTGLSLQSNQSNQGKANLGKLSFQEDGSYQYSGLSFWKELLKYIPLDKKPYELRPVWEEMAKQDLLNGYKSTLKFFPVGTYEEWLDITKLLQSSDTELSDKPKKLKALHAEVKQFYSTINSL